MTDGVEDAVLEALRKAVEKEGALLAIVAPKIGGVTTAKGKKLPADQALSGAPSVLFDAVALLPSEAGAAALVKEAAAIDWLRDAFGHLKTIGYVAEAAPIFAKAAIALMLMRAWWTLPRASQASSRLRRNTEFGLANRRCAHPGEGHGSSRANATRWPAV